MKYTVEVYVDKAGGYRWRLRYGGKTIADGAEAYTRKRDVHRALAGMAWKFLCARTVEV